VDAYPETSFQIVPAEQLTLITDGVLQARNESCVLFGFALTAAVSAISAESIAQEALSFGQDDDIMVLTMQRSAF
jgi:serine phosphatase RsbU (regulator of sigma subunit)